MIATRLSSVWQVAGVAAAALCCYLVSQSVAAERAGLVKVDRQIAAERDAIAKLGTEITTRSRLTEIESWNRHLALQAPRPGQFVGDGFQLASLYARTDRPALQLDPAIVTQPGTLERATYRPPASGPTPPADGPIGIATARTAPSLPARAEPVESPAARAARPSPSSRNNGEEGVPTLTLAHATRPARKPDPDPAAADQPLLRVATYVRPKASGLGSSDSALPLVRAAFRPDAIGSLLSPDIAALAKSERARSKASKPDK